MNNYEFYRILIESPWVYVVWLIVSLWIHYLIFKRIVVTVFDPLVFPAVFSAFSFAGVYLMFYKEAISFYVFLSYNLTQLSFFLGLFLFHSLRKKVNLKWSMSEESLAPNMAINSRNITLISFYVSTFIFLLTQGLIYYLKGIPLFMSSRLETFAQGGGSGVLGRIVDVTVICSLYSFFSIVKFDRPRRSEIIQYFFLLLIFTTFFLSGSKSAFFVIAQVLWSYMVFSLLKNENVGKLLRVLDFFKSNVKAIGVLCVLVVIAIIYVQTFTSTTEPAAGSFFLLALRFVHSADIYWYAYPNDVYLDLDGTRGFQALFTDTLGFLRIQKWADLPEAIGLTLKNIHHPSNIVQGPNARHNVFGLVYYGFFGSLFFSFFLGGLISFVRSVFPKLLRKNIFSGFVFAYLAIKIAACDSDPMLAFTYLTNAFFILPLIIAMILFAGSFFLRKHSQMKNAI